jgi:signal transduction histidine kinase
MALSLEEGLSEMGYDIMGITAFGQEAVELCDKSAPDMILMDIKLRKGIDGIEAARIINSRHDIPVVFTTAFSDDADLERAKEVSPYGYVLKPFNFREIRIAIDFAIVKHEAEKRLERERSRYQSKLQALAVEISKVEDRERNKLSEYIHDHITQKIAVAKIHLSEAMKIEGSQSSPDIEKSIRLLDEAITEARAMMFDLSPVVLFDLGLKDTLGWLSGQMKRSHGLNVSLGTIDDLDFDRETMHFLFRSARELLVNVAKHAGVSEANMHSFVENGVFSLKIEDNGKGFEKSEDVDDMRFGLFSIQESARSLNGGLHVESTPGKGTMCVIKIPSQGRR